MKPLGLSVILASFLLAFCGPAQVSPSEFRVTIEEVVKHMAPDLDHKVFAFDGQLPSPLTQPIRAKIGDVVRVRFFVKDEESHEMDSHGHNILVTHKDRAAPPAFGECSGESAGRCWADFSPSWPGVSCTGPRLLVVDGAHQGKKTRPAGRVFETAVCGLSRTCYRRS